MEENEFFKILKNTYLNYGERQIYKALYIAVCERDYDYFSKINGEIGLRMVDLLRKQTADYNIKELSNMFLIDIVDLYVDCIKRKEKPENKLEEIILSCEDKSKYTLYNIMRKKLNQISTKIDGTEIENKFNEYEASLEAESLIDKIINLMCEEFVKEIDKSSLLEEIEKQVKVKKFYSTTAKTCAILSGIHDKNAREVEKTVDKKRLNAVSSIGNLRTEQQDAALIMTHPKNKKIKLLAVCDGMGGLNNGAIASHMLVKEIGKWFVERGCDLFKYQDIEIKEIIDEELHDINDMAKSQIEEQTSKEEQAGSTLVAAIVYKGEAIIINVGDSRAYAIKGGQFKQITKDQSYSQMLYDNLYNHEELYPYITRDDMRFHEKNNISAPAFFTKGNFKADVTRLHKGEFDTILLCSDGITDCLSNEEIAYISTNVEQDQIAKYLVVAANSKLTPMPDELINLLGMSTEFLRPGKDNSTVATYKGDER